MDSYAHTELDPPAQELATLLCNKERVRAVAANLLHLIEEAELEGVVELLFEEHEWVLLEATTYLGEKVSPGRVRGAISLLRGEKYVEQVVEDEAQIEDEAQTAGSAHDLQQLAAPKRASNDGGGQSVSKRRGRALYAHEEFDLFSEGGKAPVGAGKLPM